MSSKAPGLVFAALCLIWGSTWLAIKVGLTFLPPFTFAAARFACASIVLCVLAFVMRAHLPRDRFSWLVMLFLGIFQLSIPYGLVFWGEQYIPSGLSAVLFATCPFFVVMVGHLIGQEKLTRFKVAGVLFSFGGLVAIFWRDIATLSVGGLAPFLGSVAVVGSAASAGLANVVAKRNADLIDPSMNVLVQSVICTVVLLALALFTELNTPLVLSLTAVEAILYLGIVGSALAFVGMYWLLKKTTATNTSLITFITPVLALILGWAVLAEVPDSTIGLGAALILAGVYLTIKPPDRLY